MLLEGTGLSLWLTAGPFELYRRQVMTALRVYVALGLAGCAIFGGIMVWAENRDHHRLRKTSNLLTLLCLPALLIAGAVIVIGSIGL